MALRPDDMTDPLTALAVALAQDDPRLARRLQNGPMHPVAFWRGVSLALLPVALLAVLLGVAFSAVPAVSVGVGVGVVLATTSLALTFVLRVAVRLA